MADETLKFLEEEHEYYVGDQRLPSVTEIISSSGEQTDYSDVDDWILKRAAEIGTGVHKTIEEFHKGQTLLESDDSSVDAYLVGYQGFINSGRYDHIHSEKKMYCGCHWFAGTVDLVGELDGELSVIDVKTTNSPNIESWNLQTAAYNHLAEFQTELEIPARAVIHLEKSGSFNVIKCDQEDAWDRFLAHLETWREENE